MPTEMELTLEQNQQGVSYEVSVSIEGVEELKRNVRIKGEKKEALHTPRQKPEHAEFDESNTYVLERFDTSAVNPVKEILLKLSLPDHRSILTDSKMVVKRQSVKVKEIQERCISKACQDYQIKKGMSMSVQTSQVHEMAKSTRWRYEIMLG
ncbi:hypothetical protein Tco_1577739 [Tanacetum coccineum]